MARDYVPDDAQFAARFSVTDDLLHMLLMLPKGVVVRAVTWNHDRHCYEFSVQGDKDSGLPMGRIGDAVSVVTPKYRTVDGKPEFAGW